MKTIILGAVMALLPGLSAADETADCPLHQNAMDAPVVHLGAAQVDSIGTMLSHRNLDVVEAIDKAYNEGKYGKVGTDAARKSALSAFIYHSNTAFDFVTTMALQEEVIYETADSDLAEAFKSKFRNPGFYPVVSLESAMTGFGHYCLTFRLDQKPVDIVVAGEHMRGWSEDTDIDGKKVRVLNIDMKTFSADRVHVVYEGHSRGDIKVVETEANGLPMRVTLMEKITGNYVRKWGFHKIDSVGLWKTIVPGIEPAPDGALCGSAIYFPKLQLEMPLLPDVGFDDLRKYDYAEPFFTVDAVKALQAKNLDWLRIKKNLRFRNWEGEGDIPKFLRERYPDK
ncbi:MAG TPA: hypothetical protein VFR10_11255 [bacterium]|nr:hypothetical protein [bacterium]